MAQHLSLYKACGACPAPAGLLEGERALQPLVQVLPAAADGAALAAWRSVGQAAGVRAGVPAEARLGGRAAGGACLHPARLRLLLEPRRAVVVLPGTGAPPPPRKNDGKYACSLKLDSRVGWDGKRNGAFHSLNVWNGVRRALRNHLASHGFGARVPPQCCGRCDGRTAASEHPIAISSHH